MRKYQGNGIFTVPGMPTIKGEFTLNFEDSGKYSMFLVPEDQALAMNYTNLPFIMGKFTGTSDTPFFELEIDTIYLSSAKMEMRINQPLGLKFKFLIFSPIKVLFAPMNLDDVVEFRRGITNLLFWGTEIIQQGTHKVFGKITWQLNGKDIILEQLSDYENISKQLREFKDVAVTCELRTKGIFKDLGTFGEIFDNLQNLFSLASANFVTPLYEDIYLNSGLSATTLFPLKTYTFSNGPSLIDTSILGHEFKDFIDTTYPCYLTHKENLGVSYFIEFFTTSKMYSPLEVEYILSTTSFECLESYFRNWQGLPVASGGLKGKIKRMCNHFGFIVTEAELESYRLCRNSLTHEGKFPIGSNSVGSTMVLRNLMDRFVLKILGYQNKPYYNAITGNKEMVP